MIESMYVQCAPFYAMLTRWQKKLKETTTTEIAPGFYNPSVDGIDETRVKSKHAHFRRP